MRKGAHQRGEKSLSLSPHTHLFVCVCVLQAGYRYARHRAEPPVPFHLGPTQKRQIGCPSAAAAPAPTNKLFLGLCIPCNAANLPNEDPEEWGKEGKEEEEEEKERELKSLNKLTRQVKWTREELFSQVTEPNQSESHDTIQICSPSLSIPRNRKEASNVVQQKLLLDERVRRDLEFKWSGDGRRCYFFFRYKSPLVVFEP